jgi:hypothetical protein
MSNILSFTENIQRSNLIGFGEDGQLLGASMAHLKDKIVVGLVCHRYCLHASFRH